MKVRLFCFILIAAVCSSCSNIKKTAQYVPVDTKVASFMVADMDVYRQKVSLTYSWSFNPFKHIDINVVKSNVTAELLERQNGDVLIEPQYIVRKRGFLRGGSVTVSGYPAKFVDFHKMTPEERTLIYPDADQSDLD